MIYALLYYALLPILLFSQTYAVTDKDIPIHPSSPGPVNTMQTGEASRYDYSLEGLGMWSKSHNTCAVRELPKYSTRKVCNLDTGKCVECYQNDFGPKAYTDRIIDLSSHAFATIGSLRAGVMRVSIEKVK